VAEAVECLLCKSEALVQTPEPPKKKKKKEKNLKNSQLGIKHMLVVLATQEAEARGDLKTFLGDIMRPSLKKTVLSCGEGQRAGKER
jgi:hypothetical protein